MRLDIAHSRYSGATLRRERANKGAKLEKRMRAVGFRTPLSGVPAPWYPFEVVAAYSCTQCTRLPSAPAPHARLLPEISSLLLQALLHSGPDAWSTSFRRLFTPLSPKSPLSVCPSSNAPFLYFPATGGTFSLLLIGLPRPADKKKKQDRVGLVPW
ncbi:hypothetical protein GQ53DRAFT_188324 [Thozetella sp. PMI_491]|nr:hypothetical protein GQ53DRAFT_188324 [Thozetella sp. PMI_491]